MKKYTGVWGSGDAGENGIYTQGYGEQVLSSRELDKLGIELIDVISRDYADSTIESLIAQNEERMARAREARE
jgi:hypothetical protein